jgi:hypothetical protein
MKKKEKGKEERRAQQKRGVSKPHVPTAAKAKKKRERVLVRMFIFCE